MHSYTTCSGSDPPWSTARVHTPMSAAIRTAWPTDAHAIARVHVASLRASSNDLLPEHLAPLLLPPADAAPRAQAWKRWLERKRTSTFVSLVGATVTGFCTLHPVPDRSGPAPGEIASFYVLPAEWRRGTGRKLGERAVAEARARGFAEIVLWVLETNARARRFYEALGFRPDGGSRVFLDRPYASWRELRYRMAV